MRNHRLSTFPFHLKTSPLPLWHLQLRLNCFLCIPSFSFFFSVSVIGFISLDEASHITFCNPVLNWDNPSFISYITTMVLFVNFNTGSVYEALVSTADCCNFSLTK